MTDQKRFLTPLIAKAARVLKAGGLVAFPTETVYGLGANALSVPAVLKIFAAKGRPANNPLIVHVSDPDQCQDLVASWPAEAARLVEQFWPGPLTLVLPKHSSVPAEVTAGGPTVALRMPAHPVALDLIRAAGLPVAAPSANRSGYISPTRAEHVQQSLAGLVDVILDGGPTTGGLESTVLDLTSSPPRLLRPGLVKPSDIEAVVGCIQTRPHSVAPDQPLPSPGLLSRHYAPRAAVHCVVKSGESAVAELCAHGKKVGWLPLGVPTGPNRQGLHCVVMPDDPGSYANRLYDVLHQLDNEGVECIVVELPPEGEAWQAVHNRLARAAAR